MEREKERVKEKEAQDISSLVSFLQTGDPTELVPKYKEERYKNGQLHGSQTHWSREGRVIASGSFENGIGVMTFYNDGTNTHQEAYAAGEKSGVWIWWNSNGQKEREIMFKEGWYHGTMTLWRSDGSIKAQGQFVEGSGTLIYWYPEGGKQLEEQYVENLIVSQKEW